MSSGVPLCLVPVWGLWCPESVRPEFALILKEEKEGGMLQKYIYIYQPAWESSS